MSMESSHSFLMHFIAQYLFAQSYFVDVLHDSFFIELVNVNDHSVNCVVFARLKTHSCQPILLTGQQKVNRLILKVNIPTNSTLLLPSNINRVPAIPFFKTLNLIIN